MVVIDRLFPGVEIGVARLVGIATLIGAAVTVAAAIDTGNGIGLLSAVMFAGAGALLVGVARHRLVGWSAVPIRAAYAVLVITALALWFGSAAAA